MKQAIIPRVSVPVDWSAIPSLAIDQRVGTKYADVKAFAQVGYDDLALYLRLSAEESEIRAEESGLLASPCFDSCLEFFFSPYPGDLRYFNMEFNPIKTLYLGYGPSIGELTRLIVEDPQALFQPDVLLREGGWEITFRVPCSFIRRFFPEFSPAPGKTIRANFYKCADKSGHPHHLAWCPITRTGRSTFHSPSDFGTLTFA